MARTCAKQAPVEWLGARLRPLPQSEVDPRSRWKHPELRQPQASRRPSGTEALACGRPQRVRPSPAGRSCHPQRRSGCEGPSPRRRVPNRWWPTASQQPIAATTAPTGSPPRDRGDRPLTPTRAPTRLGPPPAPEQAPGRSRPCRPDDAARSRPENSPKPDRSRSPNLDRRPRCPHVGPACEPHRPRRRPRSPHQPQQARGPHRWDRPRSPAPNYASTPRSSPRRDRGRPGRDHQRRTMPQRQPRSAV